MATYFLNVRNHNVSSDVLIPIWSPYYNVLKGEEVILFNLMLMTGAKYL